jgi:hypothetical protein
MSANTNNDTNNATNAGRGRLESRARSLAVAAETEPDAGLARLWWALHAIYVARVAAAASN